MMQTFLGQSGSDVTSSGMALPPAFLATQKRQPYDSDPDYDDDSNDDTDSDEEESEITHSWTPRGGSDIRGENEVLGHGYESRSTGYADKLRQRTQFDSAHFQPGTEAHGAYYELEANTIYADAPHHWNAGPMGETWNTGPMGETWTTGPMGETWNPGMTKDRFDNKMDLGNGGQNTGNANTGPSVSAGNGLFKKDIPGSIVITNDSSRRNEGGFGHHCHHACCSGHCNGGNAGGDGGATATANNSLNVSFADPDSRQKVNIGSHPPGAGSGIPNDNLVSTRPAIPDEASQREPSYADKHIEMENEYEDDEEHDAEESNTIHTEAQIDNDDLAEHELEEQEEIANRAMEAEIEESLEDIQDAALVRDEDVRETMVDEMRELEEDLMDEETVDDDASINRIIEESVSILDEPDTIIEENLVPIDMPRGNKVFCDEVADEKKYAEKLEAKIRQEEREVELHQSHKQMEQKAAEIEMKLEDMETEN